MNFSKSTSLAALGILLSTGLSQANAAPLFQMDEVSSSVNGVSIAQNTMEADSTAGPIHHPIAHSIFHNKVTNRVCGAHVFHKRTSPQQKYKVNPTSGSLEPNAQ